MKKTALSLRLLLLGLSCWAALARVSAQSPADSAAIAQARWTTVSEKDGIVCKKTRLHVFGTEQRISMLEIDPERYRIALAQDSLRTKTSVLGRGYGAAAAINGGYFKTGTRQAVASDFIKIDGTFPPRMGGAGDGAALEIDRDGRIRIGRRKTAADATPWHENSASAMVVGPLLVENGRGLFGRDASTDRHPRSCIGLEADGTVVLIVVDGRQDHAAGMSFRELAYLCRQLGMTDALNLDGGGSSTLWVRGEGIVNSVSDRLLVFPVERPVANAVLVLPRQSERHP